MSNIAVSKWENDEGLPNIENLKRLSQVFNESLDSLLSNEPAKKERKKFTDTECGIEFNFTTDAVSSITTLFRYA